MALPSVAAWRARRTLVAALDDAQSVTLEQFTSIGRKVVASQTISPSDYPKLRRAFPYSVNYGVFVDYGFVRLQKACFVPHHRVVIATHDGNSFACQICFTCDMYSMPTVGINNMPVGWSTTLRTLFRDAGISTDAPKEVFL